MKERRDVTLCHHGNLFERHLNRQKSVSIVVCKGKALGYRKETRMKQSPTGSTLILQGRASVMQVAPRTAAFGCKEHQEFTDPGNKKGDIPGTLLCTA